MIGIMLEIERPVKKLITRLEYFIVISLSIPVGAIFGLSLTEGRLSLFTSFPAILIFTFLTIYLFKKHQLGFKNRPWSLAGVTMGISGSISFSTWGLVFKSLPEFFNYLK